MGKVLAFGLVFLLGTLVGGLAAASGNNGRVAASGLAPSPTVTATSAPVATSTPAPTSAPVATSARVATMFVNEGDMYLRATTPTELPAGTITFTITNQGPSHHEFVIVSGDPTGTVGDEPATVSEANHIGGPKGPEIGDIHPGQTRTMTATLTPGTYTAMCNYPGHYAAGMHFQFIVATSAPVATMGVNEGDMYLRPTTPTELPAGTISLHGHQSRAEPPRVRHRVRRPHGDGGRRACHGERGEAHRRSIGSRDRGHPPWPDQDDDRDPSPGPTPRCATSRGASQRACTSSSSFVRPGVVGTLRAEALLLPFSDGSHARRA